MSADREALEALERMAQELAERSQVLLNVAMQTRDKLDVLIAAATWSGSIASETIDTLERVVDRTPDGGEGSRFHVRSEAVDGLREDLRNLGDAEYRRSTWVDGETLSAEDASERVARDAARMLAGWLEEDAGWRAVRRAAVAEA